MPAIEAIARRVVPAWNCSQLSHDLRADSGAIVWERIGQFDPHAGRFEDWCATVLYNHAIDLWRKAHRGAVRPASGGDDSGAMYLVVEYDSPETSEELVERCGELRAVLDRIVWAATRVHYYGVLLLQLRLAMARRLSCQPPSDEATWRSEFPELLEFLLPWHPDEEAARLKPGWPTLLELWGALGQTIGDPATPVDAAWLCSVAQPLLPPPSQLTPDVWNHWVHRAKHNARRRLSDEAVWTRCFSRLLPDR